MNQNKHLKKLRQRYKIMTIRYFIKGYTIQCSMDSVRFKYCLWAIKCITKSEQIKFAQPFVVMQRHLCLDYVKGWICSIFFLNPQLLLKCLKDLSGSRLISTCSNNLHRETLGEFLPRRFYCYFPCLCHNNIV